MGILVMLNNFFHDFAVGLLFAGLILLNFVYKRYIDDGSSSDVEFFRRLYAFFKKVIIGSWTVIILGGIIRIVSYREYEWSEAAGRGQVLALAIKHILLISLVVWGTILQVRLSKRLRSAGE